jgi:uncharacterized membrane protein YsdA (DUF1294 family)
MKRIGELKFIFATLALNVLMGLLVSVITYGAMRSPMNVPMVGGLILKFGAALGATNSAILTFYSHDKTRLLQDQVRVPLIINAVLWGPVSAWIATKYIPPLHADNAFWIVALIALATGLATYFAQRAMVYSLQRG